MKNDPKVVFVSDVEFGLSCLEVLAELKANVVGVFTGENSSDKVVSGKASFEIVAKRLNAPLIRTEDINGPEALKKLKELAPDFLFVIGWSRLVSKQVLSIPKKTIGMHPTLLPAHRGRAAIVWALIHDLRQSGVSMFYLEPDADCGDILSQESFEITLDDNARSVYEKAKLAHIKLMKSTWPKLINNSVIAVPQDTKKASSWPKRSPADGVIDWNQSVYSIYNWVRAQSEPYPGAFTFHKEKKLIIWKGKIAETESRGASGTILSVEKDQFVVQAAQGSLIVISAQLERLITDFQKLLKRGDVLG